MMELENLKFYLKQAQSKNAKSLQDYKEANEYYHAEQIPADVEAVLQERGQPVIFENMLAMIVDKILGYKSVTKRDIEVSGRQKEDRQVALILTDIIKSVTDRIEFDRIKEASDLSLLLGMSVLEVWVQNLDETDRFGKNLREITVKNIDVNSFLIDPFSKELDASDAKYFIKTIYQDLDDFEATFGKASISKINTSGEIRKRVKFYEAWVREYAKGKAVWNRYFFTHNNLIKKENMPFKTGAHPFCIRKMNVDHRNGWYGIFRNMKPQLDFVNFAENRMANMIGSTKVIYEEGAVDDPINFAQEVNKDNAVVKVKDGSLATGKIQVSNHASELANLSAKVADKRQMAKQLSGLNEEALGASMVRLSGVAIEQRNNAGLVSLQRFLSASSDLDKIAFKKVIELVCAYFDAEQVFAVTERNEAKRYFMINEQTSEDGQRVVKNQIKAGRYDLVLRSVPTVKSNRDERFKYWSEVLKMLGGVAPELIKPLIPLMLDDSDSSVARDVREIIDKMQQDAQAQQQVNPEEELKMQLLQATLAEKNAKAKKYEAQSENIQE